MADTIITPEVLQKRSEGIKKAKSSTEHRKRMSDISKNLWQTPEFRAKHADRVPWNKLADDNKITKTCPQCGSVFVVVPSHRTRQCCSRACANKRRTGRPHINWNPNSLANAGYEKSVKGWYKEKLSL